MAAIAHRARLAIAGLSVAAAMSASLLGQTRLSAEEADRLAIEKPNPRYPSEAVSARIQGPVVLDVSVSETGSVVATKLIYGHPLLVGATVKAVRKRSYRPYLADGKPAAFITTVGTEFSIDSPHLSDQDLGPRYFTLQNACREATDQHNWSDAEAVCSGALWIAGQMAGHEGIEKIDANDNAGFVYLCQGRFNDALKYFSQALAVALERPEKAGGPLMYVYRNLAFAEQGLGHLQNALDDHAKAEAALESARAVTRDQNLKAGYVRTLKSVLTFHLKAARLAGATPDAEAIQKRLDALP